MSEDVDEYDVEDAGKKENFDSDTTRSFMNGGRKSDAEIVAEMRQQKMIDQERIEAARKSHEKNDK